MTEAERYLDMASESLASARAEVKARRYNSAANRGYYAAFQAAVAALIHAGIRPDKNDWSHRFVMDRFSSTMVKRRKVLPSRYRRLLDDLFDRRVKADYEPVGVSMRGARDSVKRAADLVGRIKRFAGRRSIAKARAAKREKAVKTAAETRRMAAGFIDEIRGRILEKYPDSKFELIERGPRDYRMIVRGGFRDSLDVQDILDGRKNDILVDHDVWIVVLAESTRGRRDVQG